VLRRRRTDPLARNLLLAIAATRIGIGAGTLLATQPALRALGFSDADAAGRVLARLVGGRDVALGALVLVTSRDPKAMRWTGLAAAAVDATDAISLGQAARHKGMGRAGGLGALSGAAAAIAGLWAGQRIRP
jgi:hypothetical protein